MLGRSAGPVTTYVALLRGINVGGKNLIRMAELRACFEGLGHQDVATYIQSGNVLFRSAGKQAGLASAIEDALSKTFGYGSKVVIRSAGEMRDIVVRAPKGFGRRPSEYRYDVIFLKEPLTPAEAMKSVSTRDGVDKAYPGKQVLYFSRLTERAGQSHLSRIVSLPVYQDITIRNWNTTTRLLGLMEQLGSA